MVARMSEGIGSFIIVWEGEHDRVQVDPKHADDLRIAVEAWVERGVDGVLSLQTAQGDLYYMKASDVRSWMLSTPGGRSEAVRLEAAQREETRAHRATYGLPWDDDE